MTKCWWLILALCLPIYATEVRVGLANVMTEPGSDAAVPQGDFFRVGVKLAFEQKKAALLKKGVSIRFEDFDYRAGGVDAVRAAKEAIQRKVAAVIGYNYSDHVFLVAKYHEQAGVPLITPYGTANRIGELGKFIYQTAFANDFQAKLLAEEVKRLTRCKGAVIVSASNCGYCQDLGTSFAKFYEAIGCHSTTFDILSEDEDFSPLVQKIQESKLSEAPVFVPNMEVVSGKIVIALSKAGLKGPFFGGDGWTDFGFRFFSKAVNHGPIEAYTITHWDEAIQGEENRRFTKAFVEKTGFKPKPSAAMAYDAALFLVEAILDCETFDSRSIQRCLERVRAVEGAGGKFYFPEGHRAPSKGGVLIKFDGRGDFTFDRFLSVGEKAK